MGCEIRLIDSQNSSQVVAEKYILSFQTVLDQQRWPYYYSHDIQFIHGWGSLFGVFSAFFLFYYFFGGLGIDLLVWVYCADELEQTSSIF